MKGLVFFIVSIGCIAARCITFEGRKLSNDEIARELVEIHAPHEVKELKFFDNMLTDVPDLSMFPNLENLDLSHNQISIFDGALNGLAELRVLSLKHNNLEPIPDGAFNGASNLIFLDISKNKLESLPDGLFNGLAALMILDISDNELKVISDQVFSGLPALVTLLLNNNKLKVISDQVFSGLPELKWLDLSNNKLESISDDAFSGLSALERIFLHHNHLTVSVEEIREMVQIDDHLKIKLEPQYLKESLIPPQHYGFSLIVSMFNMLFPLLFVSSVFYSIWINYSKLYDGFQSIMKAIQQKLRL
jgi:hypothetical protein